MTAWKVGDRVLVNPLKPGVGLMGEMTDGGMAEYARVDARQLIALPDNVTFRRRASAAGGLWHCTPHADHPPDRQGR